MWGVGVWSSILDQGTKSSHATGQKKKKKKNQHLGISKSSHGIVSCDTTIYCPEFISFIRPPTENIKFKIPHEKLQS